MHKKVKKYIVDKKLFSLNRDKIILAISGGADSISLLHVLLYLKVDIELAHCNFRLRNEESDKDEEFVKLIAKKYSLVIHSKSFDTELYAREKRVSTQMAARELRYNWFNILLKERKANYLATAHHKDDSIETFFINLIRGTGMSGLSGISNQRKKIIRPLLDCSRRDIELYLLNNNLKYREDSSNKSTKYLRNNIRNSLIPLLEDLNPNIKSTIFMEMKILQDTFSVFSNHINDIRKKIIIEKSESISINVLDLKMLKPLSAYLFELLKPYDFLKIEDILLALESQSGKIFYSNTHKLVVDREKIIIVKRRNILDEATEFNIDKDREYFSFPISLKFLISSDIDISLNENVAELDFEKLQFPLQLRKWQKGDKFMPLGMNRFKKLSDFFIDEKFSLIKKENQWLLCSKNDIVWVIGIRIDDRFKVTSKTKKLYIAEVL